MSDHPVSFIKIDPKNRWAERLSYSRVVLTGSTAYVSGTGPTDAEGKVLGATASEQAKVVFESIERALAEAGLSLANIVRLRLYILDFADVEEVTRVQRETFAAIRPACTIIAVSQLYAPGVRVYVDADAEIFPAEPPGCAAERETRRGA